MKQRMPYQLDGSTQIHPHAPSVAEPIFRTTTDELDLDVYQMRVDDMNPLNGSDWRGFSGDVSSISFRHYDQPNEVWVPGCKGWTAILYDETNFKGNEVPITGSQSRLSDIGWNDRAKSFKLIGPANNSAYSPPAGCTIELWIAGTNQVPGGYEIFRWREDLFDWQGGCCTTFAINLLHYVSKKPPFWYIKCMKKGVFINNSHNAVKARSPKLEVGPFFMPFRKRVVGAFFLVV